MEFVFSSKAEDIKHLLHELLWMIKPFCVVVWSLQQHQFLAIFVGIPIQGKKTVKAPGTTTLTFRRTNCDRMDKSANFVKLDLQITTEASEFVVFCLSFSGSRVVC